MILSVGNEFLGKRSSDARMMSYFVAYCVAFLSFIQLFRGKQLSLGCIAREKAFGTRGSGIALDTDGDNRLCEENIYANTLSLPLSEYGELMDDWMSKKLKKESALTAQTREFLHNWKRFDAFEVMGSCTESCIGGECKDDVSKIVCLGDNNNHNTPSSHQNNLSSSPALSANAESRSEDPPCIIYSIGGNNNWDFEVDALRKTSCQVHTFDCTGPITRFQKPRTPRLHFHHVCLGTENKPSNDESWGEFMTLDTIQQTFGHPKIDLLKMDIEGYEFPVLESWPLLSDKRSPNTVLPMQILVEVHYRTHMTELAEPSTQDFKFSNDMISLQARFLNMGYAVVVRDDNRICVHCTELTLVRIRCPPPPATI